jgi:hypothetical protein
LRKPDMQELTAKFMPEREELKSRCHRQDTSFARAHHRMYSTLLATAKMENPIQTRETSVVPALRGFLYNGVRVKDRHPAIIASDRRESDQRPT